MRAKSLLIAVSCINLLACLNAVLGDGGVFIKRAQYADIFQPTQKVYIRWDGSQEKLLIQTKYEGPAEEMVWIVPVPSKPTVEMGDAKVFETLGVETSTPDISVTQFAGLFHSWTGETTSSALIAGAAVSAVEWRRRVGEYDVVLLRPVGEENVTQWLNTSEFSVPNKAMPILQDYVRDGWWMVAAKIHPDALTDVTREKLASGLLRPLEITFESRVCLFPMRLTSIAAGPVEELIYVEGPTHCEPATYADSDWEIKIFGGPIRILPEAYYTPDVESAAAIVEGRTTTIPKPYLTKLRRVFEPNEMTEDIIFRTMDYARLAESGKPLQIAQAATQYGRHRDPNGISSLLGGLSPDTLEQARRDLVRTTLEAWDAYEELLQQVRSCIWALGEMAVEHKINDAAEETLLKCAQHKDILIRMDAYIALTKLGSQKLGPSWTDSRGR